MDQNRTYFETPSQIAHKRERFWRILFPMIAAGMLLLGIMVYLAVFNHRISPSLEILAGVSVVILSLPFFLFALLKLAVLIGMIYGVGKLEPLVPAAGQRVLQLFEKARWHLRKGADISVQPILGLRETAHKLGQVKRSLQVRLMDKGK
jgi:hypothetical protein